MADVRIKILKEGTALPKRATSGSVAVDLCAAIDEPLVLHAGETVLIPTGFAMEIPEGYGAFIFARSGLGIKKGIIPANCVGVIDYDYRGEVKVGLYNHSTEDYTVEVGERIAQMAIMPVSMCDFVLADSLDETERGTGGFGSTGK